MNLISQDDHLTAGAWAACGVSSDKLSFFLSLRVNLRDIFVRLKVMLFFCYKNENIRYTKCPISTRSCYAYPCSYK